MIREILKIRTDNGLGNNDPAFKGIELTDYNAKFPRMGMPSLTASLKWPTPLDDEWTRKEHVTLRGERFYIRHTPSGKKDNQDERYNHDIEFTSEFAEIIGNTYFEDYVPDHSATYNKPCSNSSRFTFYGTLAELVDRLNCSFLKAGIGDSILETKTNLTTNDTVVGDGYCVMVDPYGDYDPDKTYEFSWEDKSHWGALTEGYNITGIPFERRGSKVIFGARPKVVEHKFEYGHDNELLSVSKKNANAKVINRITMRGSSENIPYHYPNETEYGHLSVKARSDNNVLTADMLTIEYPSRLLSVLREGEYAELIKKGSDLGSVQIDADGYQSAFTSTSRLESVALDSVIRYPNTELRENVWYIRAKFSVSTTGAFKCAGVYGRIWKQDQAGLPMENFVESNVSVYGLYRIGAKGTKSEVTTKKERGYFDFGNLSAGTYEVIFSIPFKVYGNMDMFFMLHSISVTSYSDTKLCWKIGTKEYSSIDMLGVKLSAPITEDMIGDGFGWTASGRMPFQENLVPPKYRETEGAERFYNAINLNLVKESESVAVEAGDNNFAHKILYFEQIPVFREGEKFAFSVDGWENVQGTPDEYSIGIYNYTEKVMVIPALHLSEDKKKATGIVENVPTVENASIYVIVYAGKNGSTSGNKVVWNNVMVVRGDKAMPWHPSVSECGLDEYIDPDTGLPYYFPNPYMEGAPSEHIYEDEKIKPTIEGVKNASGQLLGEIAAIAYDENDNDILKTDATEDKDKNDSLKYEHSYFYIKLNVFNGQYGFDLFKSASQTDPMTLQMISGNCNGCKFKIQVAEFEENGVTVWKNPVQTLGAGGNIVSGDYEDKVNKDNIQSWQQNTQSYSIWICVQKDAETFGQIMPNKSNNYKPAVGDKFNIINIDLPQSYIDFAEKRLEEDGMRFMADNNEEKFTFDIQASRIFFAENPSVLAQIDEYSKIKVIYNGKDYEQYVNQLTIDCKDSEALPNIGIDLTDTLAVGQSFVENVAERAASLISNATTMGGNLGTGGGGLSPALAEQRYLNKQRDDRTPFKLSSDVGFEVGKFLGGSQGGIFYQDPETGQTYIEADKLKIRMKAIFEELEIAKVSTIGGKFVITPGGGVTISFVEELEDSYRCYFKGKDDDKGAECRFVVGDLVQCQEFNIQGGTYQQASNRYYWRRVTAVNNQESYFELSKTDCDNANGITSDAPVAGDTVVQLGSDDTDRQSAIILSTIGADAPSIILYNGINNYSLEGKAVVSFGYDKATGQVFFRLGSSNDTHYLEYTQSGGLEVAGKISTKSTIGDKPVNNYIKDVAASVAEAYTLDLSREMIGVPTDSGGTPLKAIPTVKATLYRGTEEWEADSFSIKSITPDGGIDASIDNGIVSLSNLTADSVAVEVQASYGDWDFTATLEVYKVKPGADGKTPNIYEVTADTDVIKRSMTGELTPSSIVVRTYVTVGNNAPVLTSSGALFMTELPDGAERPIYRSAGTGTTFPYSINSDTTSVVLEYRDLDDNVLDRKTIPVLSDASDIQIGTRNLLRYSKSLAVINPNNNVWGNNFLLLSEGLKANTYYAFRVGKMYMANLVEPATGTFAMRIYDKDVTAPYLEFSINVNERYVVFKTTQAIPSGAKLYLYSGDSVTGTIFPARLTYLYISLVEGNVPLTDWQAAPEDIEQAIGKFDYLEEAMKEDTVIEGGLILASTVSLGQNNSDYTSQTTWSGLNGIYKQNAVGGGIASWYGGDMYDLAEYYEWSDLQGGWVPKSNVTIPQRIAKGVDRMDGSGYRAGGNLWWNADGDTTFIGTISARGTFRGLRKRAKTIITNQNYLQFVIQKPTDLEGEYTYELNLEATGSYVEVQFTLDAIHLYLPDDIAYVGETLVFTNPLNTQAGLQICGESVIEEQDLFDYMNGNATGLVPTRGCFILWPKGFITLRCIAKKFGNKSFVVWIAESGDNLL